MSKCMNKSNERVNQMMVSQQILTTVMACIVVDKNTDQAKPHWNVVPRSTGNTNSGTLKCKV